MQDNIQVKRIKRAFLLPLILLIIPFIANLTIEGWNWSWSDFVFAYVLWTIFGQIFVYLTKGVNDLKKKSVIGLVVFSLLAIIWVILATG